MDKGVVVKSLLMPLERIIFLLKLRGGTDFLHKPVKAATYTPCERKTTMRFNYGEFADGLEDAGDLEGIVVEFEEFWILESEPVINPIPDVPMDDYLEKELERQEQEKLVKMLPDRIP